MLRLIGINYEQRKIHHINHRTIYPCITVVFLWIILNLHFSTGSMIFDWLVIEYEYIISIGTGNELFGGTDANVFVKICGEKRCSGEIQLKGSSTNPFERGDRDVFKVISLKNLGMLQ